MERERLHGPFYSFLVISVVCMLWTVPGDAQSLLTVPYSLEDGLVQSQVIEIYQDSKGYIWFGTFGGLSRFDGLNFTNYTIDDGLASNRIFGLAEDHEGRLWIGTPKGISIFDGTSFTHLTTRDGLLNDEILELLGLPSGDIWIASRSGLTLYDGDSFSHITEVDGLASPFVTSLATGNAGNLWVGTSAGACLLKEGDTTCYAKNEGLPENLVSSLLVDQRGRVWAGTASGIGLLLPGKDNRRFISLDYLPQQRVSSILEDRTGAIWIAGGTGIYRLDMSMNITYRWDDGQWIGAALYQDREGTLWAGTYGRGIVQFRQTAFTNKSHQLSMEEDVYLSVFEDADSSFWAGTRFNGLYRIEGEEVEHFDSSSYPFLDQIRSIKRDSAGSLWLAIADGVARYDESGFTHFPKDSGFYGPFTYSVLPDTNGITWAGNTSGLYKMSNDSISGIPLPILNGGRTIHTIERIEHTTWIGAEEGLMYLKEDSLHHAPVLQGTPILSIAPDQTGALWLGTMGSGVYLYDPVTEQLADSISSENGLNSSAVYFVETDSHDRLWIGTNKGINKVLLNAESDKAEKHIKVFGQKDGIVGVETNKNAVTLDHQGQPVVRYVERAHAI